MLAHIEQRTPDLSRAEQRVAHWVLEHPKQASTATLKEVANNCGTSEPTVIRFCRHVGLDGFREFTIRMTEAISRPAIYVHRNVSKDDTASDAVSKVMDTTIRTLVDIRARASSMPFEEAVAAMVSARQLVFVGLGASGHVAEDASHKFFRLGVPCTALTDMPTTLQFAAIAQESDVLLLISRSGDWQETQSVARLAKERGATVIAVTAPGSPLARMADIVFACQIVDDASVYTPMSSRLAHLTLLDALQVSLALAQGDDAVENLKRSKDAIREWPDRKF